MQGLAANVEGGLQKITACGGEAILDKQNSDGSIAKFKAPIITTLASEAAANRSQPDHLKPKLENIFASHDDLKDMVFDGLA